MSATEDAGAKKATSPAQRAARSKNAQEHSTGPRTREGKARSSQNALKHGGYAHKYHFITQGPLRDDPEEVAGLTAGLIEELHPASPLQQEFVDDVVHAALKKRRLRRWERETLEGIEADLLADVERENAAEVLRPLLETNWHLSRADEVDVAIQVLNQIDGDYDAATLEVAAGELLALTDVQEVVGWDDSIAPSSVNEWRAVIRRIIRLLPGGRQAMTSALRDRTEQFRATAAPGQAWARRQAARSLLSSGFLDNVGRVDSHLRADLRQALNMLRQTREEGW